MVLIEQELYKLKDYVYGHLKKWRKEDIQSMKRKVFSILFALVLVASFSLVTAVPVASDHDGFDNPDYYYAAVKVAPEGIKYSSAGLSPDGTKIVAQKRWYEDTTYRSEIVLMDADGSNEIMISANDSGTEPIVSYGCPFWSDDGTIIGFGQERTDGPNKVMRYDVVWGGPATYLYEPTTGLPGYGVCNADFLGGSKTSIVFWDYGAGGNVADLFIWDGTTCTNVTNTADYKEYEPVSNADGTVIVYWSGESAAEPINTTHTLTCSGGTWTKDVGFTPIADSYWAYWSGRSDNYIGLTRMSTKDVEIYDSSGGFVIDLTGDGYEGGSGQWNFFGSGVEGPNGEFLMTSNAASAWPSSSRDIVVAAPRDNLFVDDDGSDSNPGTEAAPFATIQKAVDESAGSTINVAPGEYAGAIVDKDVTIIGAADGSSVITSGVPYKVGGSYTTAFRLDAGADGAEIRNFTVNCDPPSKYYFAVFARGVDDVVVDSLAVNDPIQGITNWGGSGWKITSNVLTDTAAAGGGGIGIFLGATPPEYPVCSGNLVQFNTITSNATAPTYTCPGMVLALDLRYGAYDDLTGTEELTGNQILDNDYTGTANENEVGIEVGVIGLEGNTTKVEQLLGVIHDNAIENNRIDNTYYGMYFYVTTNLTVGCNTITNCNGSGIYMADDNAGCHINNNKIYDNAYGLDNADGAAYGRIVDATDNWWGDVTGPKDLSGTNEVPPCTDDPTTEVNADGLGDEVSDYVDYCPWEGLSSVQLEANICAIVSISVSPTSIDYGTITLPFLRVDTLTVTNEGTVDVTVTHEITGDTLFTDYLEVLDVSEDIAVECSATFDATLDVPSSYSAIGLETGQIIFWAEAK